MTDAELEACEAIMAGVSPSVAYLRATGHTSQKACRDFLADPDVRLYLAVRRMEVVERRGLSDERWVAEVSNIAYFDIAEVAESPPTCPEDLACLPAHVRQAIAGWHWDKHNHFVVDFVSKKAALDMLAKFLGVYQKDQENLRDVASDLLKAAFWKFVLSMHVHDDVSIAEALMVARNNPADVEAWAKARGLLKSGEVAG